MTENELIQLSVNIIRHYCSKDLLPFFKYVDENALWIGPRKGQIVHSKDRLMAGWIDSKPYIDFKISNPEARILNAGPRCWEVFLNYTIYGKTEGGKSFTQPQRAQFTWVLKQKEYRILVLHFSNPADLDERDLVYNTWGDISSSIYLTQFSLPADPAIPYITIQGLDKTLYRYLASSIMWAESSDEGRHCLIHARDQVIPCAEKLAFFEKEYPTVFLRIHISYLVNPIYIKSIRRFSLTLWDGTVLPIPEKKYTALKKRLQN